MLSFADEVSELAEQLGVDKVIREDEEVHILMFISHRVSEKEIREVEDKFKERFPSKLWIAIDA